jgi:hypothetical protein
MIQIEISALIGGWKHDTDRNICTYQGLEAMIQIGISASAHTKYWKP